MRTAALIVGGVFSSLGIMFFAALDANSTTAHHAIAPNSVTGVEAAQTTLISTSHPSSWSSYITQN